MIGILTVTDIHLPNAFNIYQFQLRRMALSMQVNVSWNETWTIFKALSRALDALVPMKQFWNIFRKIGWGPFYLRALTSIPVWISNHINSKVRDEIIYPFPNFNGSTIKVWERIRHFIPHPESEYLSVWGSKLKHVSKCGPWYFTKMNINEAPTIGPIWDIYRQVSIVRRTLIGH